MTELDVAESEWLDLVWSEYLTHNLAVGGALCRSFALGETSSAFHGWSPGCQKPHDF